jgi:hypothetical protein
MYLHAYTDGSESTQSFVYHIVETEEIYVNYADEKVGIQRIEAMAIAALLQNKNVAKAEGLTIFCDNQGLVNVLKGTSHAQTATMRKLRNMVLGLAEERLYYTPKFIWIPRRFNISDRMLRERTQKPHNIYLPKNVQNDIKGMRKHFVDFGKGFHPADLDLSLTKDGRVIL